MTIPVELLPAKNAFAARYVERHEHVVARLEVVNFGPDFLDIADDLVAECRSDPRVGHGAVVKVKVRAADTRPRHANDRILGMLYLGLGFLVDANAPRSTIICSKHERKSLLQK